MTRQPGWSGLSADSDNFIEYGPSVFIISSMTLHSMRVKSGGNCFVIVVLFVVVVAVAGGIT